MSYETEYRGYTMLLHTSSLFDSNNYYLRLALQYTSNIYSDILTWFLHMARNKINETM